MGADPTTTRKRKTGASWLSRLSALRSRGDAINATVGEHARGVAVGKNIVQIGTLQFPAAPFFAALLLVVAGLGAWGWSRRGPSRMNENFNVAMAGFTQVDAAGRVTHWAEGDTLSRTAFQTMGDQQPKFAEVFGADKVLMWHDSLGWTAKSTRIGFVTGSDTAERERHAADLAEQLNAHVLVYGTLDAQRRLTLRFHVSPELQIPGSASSLAGYYELGAPIPMGVGAAATGGPQLNERTAALFWLVKGIQYNAQGRFDLALAILERAERELPFWKGKGSGRELLGYFQGESALFLANEATTEEDFDAATARAQAAFLESIANNPDYVRPVVGLASVAFVRADCLLRQNPCAAAPDAEIETLVRETQATYERAVALGRRFPEQALSRDVAPLGLGMARGLEGTLHFVRHRDDEAERLFEQAIAEIEPVIPLLQEAGEYRLLALAQNAQAETFARHGEIRRDRRDHAGAEALFKRALVAYRACAAQTATAPGDVFLADTLAPLCREREQAAADELSKMRGTP